MKLYITLTVCFLFLFIAGVIVGGIIGHNTNSPETTTDTTDVSKARYVLVENERVKEIFLLYPKKDIEYKLKPDQILIQLFQNDNPQINDVWTGTEFVSK